jgi:hypothetical protein
VSFYCFTIAGVDLLRAFVSMVRRNPARYARGLDADPEVTYERMPSVHFAIDGTLRIKGLA